MIIKFDDRNFNWSKDEKYNRCFVKYVENYLNDLLQARGYVTVMEVYRELGVYFDIGCYLDKPLKDVVWLLEERGVIDFKPEFKDDGTVLLHFNID